MIEAQHTDKPKCMIAHRRWVYGRIGALGLPDFRDIKMVKIDGIAGAEFWFGHMQLHGRAVRARLQILGCIGHLAFPIPCACAKSAGQLSLYFTPAIYNFKIARKLKRADILTYTAIGAEIAACGA
jgi:hypothetical protein